MYSACFLLTYAGRKAHASEGSALSEFAHTKHTAASLRS